ncbi:MAG TPA: hypothetical protein VMU99_01725, partial [Acidimicrobiales bacterium]|nr:hypothetical protein [Acidimicrobiales bacterium]
MRHTWIAKALTVLTVVSGAGMAAFVSSAAASNPNYGISFGKGCESPTSIGSPYLCYYSINNNLDPVGDTYTISNLSDTVATDTGPVTSPSNTFSQLSFVIATGSPTCTGGTGNGTALSPYTGETYCTLPTGA